MFNRFWGLKNQNTFPLLKKKRWKGNKGMFEYLYSHCLALGPTALGRGPWKRGHSSLCWKCFYLEFQFRQKKPTVRRKNNSKIPHFLLQRYPS